MNGSITNMNGLHSKNLESLDTNIIRDHVNNGRIKEGFEFLKSLQPGIFRRESNVESLKLVTTLLEACKLKFPSDTNDSFYEIYFPSLASLAICHLKSKNINDSEEILHRYDVTLANAYDYKCAKNCWKPLLSYFTDEFLSFCADLILLKLKKGKVTDWRKAFRLACLCYLCLEKKPNHTPSTAWYRRYVLFNILQANQMIDSIRSHFVQEQGWEVTCESFESSQVLKDLFRSVFSTHLSPENATSKSFLLSRLKMPNANVEAVVFDEVLDREVYEEILSLDDATALDCAVWSLMFSWNFEKRVLSKSDMIECAKKGLNFAPSSPEAVNANDLAVLDLKVFLHLSVHSAVIRNERIGSKLKRYPLNIIDFSTSDWQRRFWTSCMKLLKEGGSADVRTVVGDGLNFIRLKSKNAPTLQLVYGVVLYLESLVFSFRNSGDKLAIVTSDYAQIYWKYLHKLLSEGRQIVSKPDAPFHVNAAPLSRSEIDKILTASRFYTALNAFLHGKTENALSALQTLNFPQSYLVQAEIYKKSAEKIDTKSDTDEKAVLRKRALMTKAQEALQEAKKASNISEGSFGLSDFDEDSSDGFVVIGNNESMSSTTAILNQSADFYSPIDDDSSFMVKNAAFASDSAFCTPKSNLDRTLQLTTRGGSRQNSAGPSQMTSFFNNLGNSLDLTMRNLTHTNDLMLRSVLEQNKALNETIKSVTDQVRDLTLVNKELTFTNKELTGTNRTMLDEMKEMREQFMAMKIESLAPKPTKPVVDDHSQSVAPLNQQPNLAMLNSLLAQQLNYPMQMQQALLAQQQQQRQTAEACMAAQQQFNQMFPPAGFALPPAMYQQQQQSNVSGVTGQQVQPKPEVPVQPVVLPSKTPDKTAKPVAVSTATPFNLVQQPTTTTVVSAPKPTTFPSIKGNVAVPVTTNAQAPATTGGFSFSTAAPPKPVVAAPVATTAPTPPTTTQPAPVFSSFTFTPKGQVVTAKLEPEKSTTLAKPIFPPAVTDSLKGSLFGKAEQNVPKTTTDSPKPLFSFSGQPQLFGVSTASPVQITDLATKPIFGGSSTPVVPPTATAPTTAPIFGMGSKAASNLSFSDMAKQAAASPPAYPAVSAVVAATGGFSGFGQPVFSSLTQQNSKSPGFQKTASGEHTDENAGADEPFEPNVDFKPLIPLPDLVEVKTGEENETVLFKQRCKLYRFDPETNEFKERGLGELKLLRNELDGKCRLLMRREQTLKLCANHYLLGKINLKPMTKSDKAFAWECNDFSDGDLNVGILAARFKTPQMADEFKQVFENCVAESEKAGSTSVSKADSQKQAAPVQQQQAQGFGDQFKPKAGSWNCQACMLNNAVDKSHCASCGTSKDGLAPTTTPLKFGVGAKVESSPQTPQYAFGFPTNTPPGKSIFGNTTATTPSSGSFGTPGSQSSVISNSGSSHPTPTAGPAEQCPGCMACRLSDSALDQVFTQLDAMSERGPQFPMIYEDNSEYYEDAHIFTVVKQP